MSCPGRAAGARLAKPVAAGATALAAYHAAVRPRALRWGATRHEARRPMPGDSAVPAPQTVTTRGVTIRALPEQIWPWLVQMGDRRGGLYSYDVLDRLFGYISGPSADTILPELQNLSVGDVIPIGRGPSWPVIAVDRNRALVIEPVPGAVSWCFALYPEADATRLVSRVRVAIGGRPLMWLLAPVLDAPWLLMERKMLLGIKRRAESLAERSPS